MNWLLLTLTLLVLLFFLKNFKHHLIRKSITLAFAIFLVLLVMMFASSYFDLGSIFSKDSLLAKTGASVIDTVSENVDTSSISSFFSESFSSITNFTKTSSQGSDKDEFIKINK